MGGRARGDEPVDARPEAGARRWPDSLCSSVWPRFCSVRVWRRPRRKASSPISTTVFGPLSPHDDWVWELDNASVFVRWFDNTWMNQWMVLEIAGEDSGFLRYEGDETVGRVPEGAKFAEVCAKGDSLPETDISFQLTIYPPGHPGAPSA